jgi:hypothetical protein
LVGEDFRTVAKRCTDAFLLVEGKQMLGNADILLVASQPKSGSTFFCTAIAKLLRYQGAVLVPDWNRREQEIDGGIIKKYKRSFARGYVAHSHVRNSAATTKLTQQHGIRTLVMVRNLYDVIPSIRDHIRKESLDWPMAWLTESHKALPDEALEYAIARLMMPWYMNFYMSWRSDPKAWFLSYEEMIGNPPAALMNASWALGYGRPPLAEAEAAATAARGNGARFNIGVAGRGRDLSDRTKQAVADVLNLYPEALADEYIKPMIEEVA